MARIPPLETETLATPERDAIHRAETLMGFTANDALTMARMPRVMHAFGDLVHAIYAPGDVDDGLKRLIGLITSAAAGCSYCMGHTALSGKRFGVPDSKLAAVFEFEVSPEFNDAERAALRVALEAGQSPSGVTDEMFAELASHFDEGQQLEIVSVIALFGFLNRWNATLATDLEGLPAEALDQVTG